MKMIIFYGVVFEHRYISQLLKVGSHHISVLAARISSCFLAQPALFLA